MSRVSFHLTVLLPHPILLILLALAMLFAASCTPDVTCVEIGCPYEYTCNAGSGECEIDRRDCTVVGCPDGQHCDVQQGICRPEAVSCRNQPCSRHQICNTQTGFCEALSNCVADGCPSAAETCDIVSGRCVALPCAGDGQCPASFVCGQSGVCVTGCRPNSGACPAGEYCRVPADSSLGQCVPQCQSDVDCPFGQRCETSAGRSTCQFEPPCEVSSDCRDDEVCLDHTCTHPPCSDAADCPGDQICNRSTGQCVAGDCTDDIFAPNHSRATAAPLVPGSYGPLALCPGQSDWYRLDVRAGEALRVRLEHASARDLDLYLVDAAGRIVGLNQRRQSLSVLEHHVTRTQALHLLVATDGFVATSYQLDVQLTDAQFCTDDAYEDNDTMAEATVLTFNTASATELPLQLCGHDEDWFVLPGLRADNGLHVRYRNAPSGFVGRVLTPDGAVLAPGVGENMRLRRLGTAGDYYLQTRMSNGRAASYRMLFHVQEPWQCTPHGTQATLEAAAAIAPDAPQRVTFCPDAQSWDIHWFALAPPEGDATLTVEVSPDTGAPALQVSAFVAGDEGPQVLRTASALPDGRLALAARLDAGAPAYLRVTSDAALGRIFEFPAYTIEYRYDYDDIDRDLEDDDDDDDLEP